MDSQTKRHCSFCKYLRPISELRFNEMGNQLMTCSRLTSTRSSKKRFLTDVNEWDSFLYEIKSWSHVGQTILLDIKYNFSLGRLTVKFRQASKISEDDSHHLSIAIGEIVDFPSRPGQPGINFTRNTSRTRPNNGYSQ
ncbi:hypothetical protein K3495_g12240 [Podosphaera aphanis]|nr:hypothetical protein K3495_g12240 [Podosphaera aphanis]